MPGAVLLAVSSTPTLGHRFPAWSVLPFVLMLLSIALLPLLAPRFWSSNRSKALLVLVLGSPVALWTATLDWGALLHTVTEYLAFIVLLGALFVIAGGVVVRGTLAGTPGLNVALLGSGAVLASLIGTTGASMVLIRPLLRANSVRRRQAHVVVFFIFVVANAGGLLTPLGDPPLFLGYLRGVPFGWTLGLWRAWLMVNAALLVIFYVVDSTVFRQEDLDRPVDLDKLAVAHRVPVHVAGWGSLGYLLVLIGVLLVSGTLRLPVLAPTGAMFLVAALCWVTTPGKLRTENAFSWHPIAEVAILFAGIFATMIPPLAILNAYGAQLALREPFHYFWASGALSSFLDNAPTYLAFASAASAQVGTDATNLGALVAHERGEQLLIAISLGSVLMGANTYIGNGPNFLVKAIAEHSGVRMPGFFRYLAYSAVTLLPLFYLVSRTLLD
jgi:Na+/H+ antiporter NhaD/arsenite permease-like protein